MCVPFRTEFPRHVPLPLYKPTIKPLKETTKNVNYNYATNLQPKFSSHGRLYHKPKKEPQMTAQTLVFTSALSSCYLDIQGKSSPGDGHVSHRCVPKNFVQASVQHLREL